MPSAASVISVDNPVFVDFAFYAVVVLLKLLFMAFLTGMKRFAKGVYANPEDKRFFKNGQKEPVFNDPDVERVRRNHLNDLENILPFVLFGIIYVLIDPSRTIALWHFRVFAGARIVHTIAYQLSKQPFRAYAHLLSLAVSLSMAVQILIATAY